MKPLRRNHVVFRIAIVFLIPILACKFIIPGTPEEDVPTMEPTGTPSLTASPEATWTPSMTPTKTQIPTSTVNPIASSFGDPILSAIQGLPPIFEDDFSRDRGWQATTGGTEALLPLSLEGGFIQTLNDGDRVYTHIVSPWAQGLKNFAVTLDAAFMGNPEQNRDRTIGLCWWPGDDHGERFLLYESGEYLGGTCKPDGPCPDFVNGRIDPIAVEQFIALTLIHRRGESVVYVNGRPVAYHKLSFNKPQGGFSLCPHTFDGRQTDIKYDNVRVWNLDQIPGLP